jgi:NAD(P)-dependent dehydrogenase (short-subunit alcohol dehydrogenase family)
MSSEPQVALVTGASRGIGQVVVRRLAGAGYRVAAVARSAEPLASVCAETGATPVVLDVTDAEAVGAAMARVEAEIGPVALLVNNAGVSGPSLLSWEMEPAQWWQVFEVNVLGAFLCSRAVLPAMAARGAGRIVNVSSNAAFFRVDASPFTGIRSAYMASKAALVRFTDALAAEAAGFGVKAFAISPGTVKTDMTAQVFADEWDDEDLWSSPELTADLVEYLGTGALDAPSGRYLHSRNDDWRSFAERAPQILADDLLAMRLRSDADACALADRQPSGARGAAVVQP